MPEGGRRPAVDLGVAVARLRRDTVMRQLVGDRAVKRGAASASATGRFETEMATRPDNLAALSERPRR